MPGNLTDYKKSHCETALNVLSKGKSLAAVCAALDICRQTLINWRNTFPEFDEAVKRGLQKAQSKWEDIGESGIVGEHEKFSAPAWIFSMKNRFREDYKEDKEHQSVSASEPIIAKILEKLAQ